MQWESSPSRGQRTGSGASSIRSQASNASKASQRSWEADDIFDQVLQAISEEVDRIITFLGKNSARITKMFTKTGRTQRDIQQDLKTELKHFRSMLPVYHGVFSGRSQTESGDASEEYKTCRGEKRTLGPSAAGYRGW